MVGATWQFDAADHSSSIFGAGTSCPRGTHSLTTSSSPSTPSVCRPLRAVPTLACTPTRLRSTGIRTTCPLQRWASDCLGCASTRGSVARRPTRQPCTPSWPPPAAEASFKRDDADTIDGAPTFERYVREHGRVVHGALHAAFAPLEAPLLEHVRGALRCPACHVFKRVENATPHAGI